MHKILVIPIATRKSPAPKKRLVYHQRRRRPQRWLQKRRQRDKREEKKRIELEKKERAISLQKERDSSTIKCSCCGDGILGVGFDKFGKKFCSTKCARAERELKSYCKIL